MGKVKKHWNIDRLDSEGATINIVVGERANGKSYQVKHKKGVYPYLMKTESYVAKYYNKHLIVKESVEAGSEFILVRRWREEITPMLIEKYFDDVDIESITNGKYQLIIVYRNEIFLSTYDEKTKKVSRGDRIGYVVALSTEQKYAGGSYLKVRNIIFEEFMSRQLYIAHESAKLMNLYSTIDRKRGVVKMWLVGNTITKVCPYLVDWGLLELVKNMKQGDIKTKWLGTGDYDDEGREIEVKLAIEFCESTGDSSFIIGLHKEMLNRGKWQYDPQPHLTKSRNDYKLLFRMLLCYKTFKFIAEYITDGSTCCWFIKPYSGEIEDGTLVFSDVIKPSPYYQRDIYNPMIKSERIKELLKTFRECNIFYASDEVGTDFKQAIDFEIRK